MFDRSRRSSLQTMDKRNRHSMLAAHPESRRMTTYVAGVVLGATIGMLTGFLIAYWIILAWVNGWRRDS